MESWTIKHPVVVSVCCITYNQEKYISQAIDSFLMQKTTFPFEIIIGEDASKDSTLKIIESYRSRYPNIIKILTSDVNIGANANLLQVFNCSRGEYIAICEGDDYWSDPFKMAKQKAMLDEYKESDMCFHACDYLYSDGSKKRMNVYSGKAHFSANQIIDGGGEFIPTASIFLRKESVRHLPDWFCYAAVGDFYIQIIASLNGGARYIPEVMSTYRVAADNSWSTSIGDIGRVYNFTLAHVDDLKRLESFIDEKYSKLIRYKMAESLYGLSAKLFKRSHYYESLKFVCESLSYSPLYSYRQFVILFLSIIMFPFSRSLR